MHQRQFSSGVVSPGFQPDQAFQNVRASKSVVDAFELYTKFANLRILDACNCTMFGQVEEGGPGQFWMLNLHR